MEVSGEARTVAWSTWKTDIHSSSLVSEELSAASSTPTASTFTAPTPTYAPLTACPDSNGTVYTPNSHDATATANDDDSNSTSSDQLFTLHCASKSPLNKSAAKVVPSAFVYTFADCIDMCSSYDAAAGGQDCNTAVYDANGERPSNCWLATLDHAAVLSLSDGDSEDDSIGVAVLT